MFRDDLWLCTGFFLPGSFIQIILHYCCTQHNEICTIHASWSLEVGNQWNEIQLKLKGEMASIFGISAEAGRRRNIPEIQCNSFLWM